MKPRRPQELWSLVARAERVRRIRPARLRPRPGGLRPPLGRPARCRRRFSSGSGRTERRARTGAAPGAGRLSLCLHRGQAPARPAKRKTPDLRSGALPPMSIGDAVERPRPTGSGRPPARAPASEKNPWRRGREVEEDRASERTTATWVDAPTGTVGEVAEDTDRDGRRRRWTCLSGTQAITGDAGDGKKHPAWPSVGHRRKRQEERRRNTESMVRGTRPGKAVVSSR